MSSTVRDRRYSCTASGDRDVMEFAGCSAYTLGVEWELQLLDRSSLDLYPGIDQILQSLTGHPHVVPEFIQSCVELNSPIAADSLAIHTYFLSLVGTVLEQCQPLGMDLVGAGTHPFCRRLAIITPLPRYETLASEHGYIAQTQLAFANHVHVGLPSGDAAIRVMRYLTPCLPLLLAISANSPFWRAHDTGYACYRRRLLAASRSYGVPPYFDDWNAFVEFFAMAKRSKAIQTLKDIHWDIRPHPDFGTLEIRVMDAQCTVAEVAFIAGLVRILVAWIASSPAATIEAILPRRLTPWIERENHFRASHWGMQARLIADEHGSVRSVASYFDGITTATTGIAQKLNEDGITRQLKQLANRKPGYVRQREAYALNQKAHAVVASMRDELHTEQQRAKETVPQGG